MEVDQNCKSVSVVNSNCGNLNGLILRVRLEFVTDYSRFEFFDRVVSIERIGLARCELSGSNGDSGGMVRIYLSMHARSDRGRKRKNLKRKKEKKKKKLKFERDKSNRCSRVRTFCSQG